MFSNQYLTDSIHQRSKHAWLSIQLFNSITDSTAQYPPQYVSVNSKHVHAEISDYNNCKTTGNLFFTKFDNNYIHKL